MGGFLPVCRQDMERRGWDQCDFVYVTGDAYVDHPSFGTGIISRLLERQGKYSGIGQAPAGISGIWRKYGFHGESLLCLQKTEEAGSLYAGRSDGETARLCSGGVWKSDPVCV